MNKPAGSSERIESIASRAGKKTVAKKKYKLFFFSWFLLIVCGILLSVLYANHLKQQITNDIAKQTQSQLQTIQQDYDQQLQEMKQSLTSDMQKLEDQVQSFNELLSFAKDSASEKTDNSNQLYTQLKEVKKQLDELKKNLDVLK